MVNVVLSLCTESGRGGGNK